MSEAALLTIPRELEPYVKETSRNHRNTIAELSENAFKDHVLTMESKGVWRCSRPSESSIYYFHVCFLPHTIVVCGDIGDMLIRPGWNRNLGWLRGALNDGEGKYNGFGYMLSKVPGKHARRDFFPGDVIDELQSLAKDDEDYERNSQKLLDEWAENVLYDGDLERPWHEAANTLGEEAEFFCGFTDYDSEMYWCAHALRWFVIEWVKHYGKEADDEVRQPEAKED